LNNPAHPVLCGGTFLTQLLQSRRPTASHRQRTQGKTDSFNESDVLFGLVQIVNPGYLLPAGDTFVTYTSNYKKCAKNMPNDLKFENKQVLSAFLTRLDTDYPTELNKMTRFVRQFIDVGTATQMDVLLVKRLIELIRDDESIPMTAQIAVTKRGTAVTKADLINSTDEIYLPAFLLDLWKFIVTERKNNALGDRTIANWKHPAVQGRYIGIDGSTITRDIKVNCGKHLAPATPADDAEPAVAPTAASDNGFVMPDVYEYLRNAEEKYSTMKTLLYTEQPKPFYDFYVCNFIGYQTDDSPAARHSISTETLENTTIEKIRDISRFVILSGSGGLGKSMMMRHLMLNTIANFDDLKLFPVFIPLKDYVDTGLLDYAFSRVGVFDSSITLSQFELLLAHGKCVLLFDGLDEIPIGHTEKFELELEALTDKYSKNTFILSSRPLQHFVSFERFSLFKLVPFTPCQALQLINKLEFRPDEPAIKEKFQEALVHTLFRTHYAFTENPLLLTIMLLTFEQFAEIPTKMHVFYREAYEVLAKRHDASKGAYKRSLKTGLTSDAFADYFSEICFRSYRDEKFEMTADEFAAYFKNLNVREIANDKKTTANDFLEDLCSNLCLMYVEGNTYHFIHRSFQEYFCALFFSRQKDKFIARLGDFFARTQRRLYSDNIFFMLYDMIPEKVEEYILLPYLKALFDKCANDDGYWTFLEELYPQITYASDNGYSFSHRHLEPNSFIFSTILMLSGSNMTDSALLDFPFYEELEIEHIPRLREEKIYNRHGEIIDIEEVEDEEAGYVCEFSVAEIRKRQGDFADLLEALDDDEFVCKRQFIAVRKFYIGLTVRQKHEDDNLLDLL
jgi:hypothetical protein